MSAQSYTCPSCAGKLEVEHRFSKLVICPYCGQPCAITPQGLNPSGQKVELADFQSIFSLGATGEIAGEKFRTNGRLRYSYEEGFWDEWFLTLASGKKIWLQEDEGEFTWFEKETLTSAVAPYNQVEVGGVILVNGKELFVTERLEAEISGGAGELYFKITPGEKVKCVDGNCQGELMSIEYTPDELHLCVGREIPLDEIEFAQQR